MVKNVTKSQGFYLLLLSILFATGVFHTFHHAIDYPCYEFAGLRILNHDAVHLYDEPIDPTGAFYYSYAFALFMALFAFLGKVGRLAFFLLFWVSYLKILNFSMDSALRITGIKIEQAKRYLLLSGLALLTTYAVNDAFINLNIGILLLAMILLAYENRERRPYLSGILMGLAIAFKSYPALLLGFFIWEWRWKLTFTSMITALFCLFALPIINHGSVDGKTIITKFLYTQSHLEEIWKNRGWYFDGYIFQSITGTTLRYAKLLGVDANNVLRWVIGVSGLGVIVFYLKSFFVPLNERPLPFREQMFLFALALIPLFLPTSWYNLGLFYSPLIALTLLRALVLKDLFSQSAILVFTLLYCLTTPDLVTRPVNEVLSFYSVPFMGIAYLLAQSFLHAKKLFKSLNLVYFFNYREKST